MQHQVLTTRCRQVSSCNQLLRYTMGHFRIYRTTSLLHSITFTELHNWQSHMWKHYITKLNHIKPP